ncbi:MAG: response regulator [Trichlorobacter sp.]
MGSALSGKLEELGLDDILQIISLSRKTGVLTLRSQGREAILQFRDGLVVRATSTGFQQSLGELMVQKAIVDSATVAQALSTQQNEGFQERIGTILHSRHQVDLQVIEQVVREQMSNVVMTLFAWHEGSYDFDASILIETVDAAYLDPLQLMLEQGGDAEQLSAEGERLQHALGGALPATTLPESEPAVANNVQMMRCAMVVVDDDSATSQAIAAQFPADLLEVFPFTRSEEALVKVDSLYRAGRRPMVLLDLIMPKMDGSGVLGGLEILKLLRQNFQNLPVMMMTDFHHVEAEQEAAGLGCGCLLKPRRGNVDTEDFTVFMDQLRTELQKCHDSHAAQAER